MSILTMTAIAAKSAKPLMGDVNKWLKPLPRQVKVNVDASYCEDSRTGAVGVILRDYQGQFLAAAGKYIPHLASVPMAEAIVMKEAELGSTKRMQFHNCGIRFTGDNRSLYWLGDLVDRGRSYIC
jgi:hypothetical protein